MILEEFERNSKSTPKMPAVDSSKETISPHHHTIFPIKRMMKYQHKKKKF